MGRESGSGCRKRGEGKGKLGVLVGLGLGRGFLALREELLGGGWGKGRGLAALGFPGFLFGRDATHTAEGPIFRWHSEGSDDGGVAFCAFDDVVFSELRCKPGVIVPQALGADLLRSGVQRAGAALV